MAQHRLTRVEKAAQVQRLLAANLTSRQVSELLGLSYSYVRDLVIDPTGEKAASVKRSHQGTCERCGSPTTGCNGRAKAPILCAACWKVTHLAPCGTGSAYNRGCRCDACRRANANRQRAYKQRLRAAS